jgi:UDP-GlcNAc:undecaprenyl-phosphate/decaprenyl-phosphate GlcNAc-1-phosphate transferase
MILKGLVVLGVVLLAAQCAQEPTELKTEKDKVSYGIGVSVGRNFRQQGVEADVNLVVKGLKDELTGKKVLLSEDELRKTMANYQQDLRQKQMEDRKVAALENKKAGDAFLEENKKKEGVITLPSGLQYKILKAGEGKKPTLHDEVEVKYRGTFINGKEFDSSSGESRTYKVSDVVPGWKEALKLMGAGSKWQLVIPPELAYGERGKVPTIMPNATLVFEVELVGIKSGGSEGPKTEAPKPEAPKAAPKAAPKK